MLNHIGIIMDGNGRWGKSKGKSRLEGHTRGGEVALEIIEFIATKKIPYLTLYTLSVQNLKRPANEINHIINISKREFPKITAIAKRTNSKVTISGDKTLMDKDLLTITDSIELETSGNTGTHISLCLFYGGREEIVRIVRSLDEVTESKINEKIGPNVDLIIRTGGDQRLSNFLTWQSAYAELFFTKTLWPDFTTSELETILTDYRGRNRTLGEVKEHVPTIEIVAGCLDELIKEYKSNTHNLEDLYSKLSRNVPPYRVDESVKSNRKDFLLKSGLCDTNTTKLMIEIDDFIDAHSVKEQIEYLKVLSDLSLESVTKINPEFRDLFLNINQVDREYMENIYKCDYLQRTASNKDVWRYASNYYFLKVWSNNIFADEIYLYASIIVSVCDDIFDEDTDIPEMRYLNENTFYSVKGAIFDLYNKHTFIPFMNDTIYIASSVVIDKYVRKLGQFQNMSECVHYLTSLSSS
jgi:undecaprenyl diphosphate synthase